MKKIVGIKIKKLREEIGLTQENLAKAVGLSSEFISFLELGKRDPSLESLLKIARFFKKDISYFLIEKDDDFDILMKEHELQKKAKREIRVFQNYCKNYIKLEEQTGRCLRVAPIYSYINPEKMAEEERRRLGLGFEPIKNIFSLIELNGLRLLKLPLSEESKTSGIFLFIEKKQAAFALINSNQPFENQVLMAAHEYCHYLKDRFDGPIVDNPDIFVDEYLPLYPGRENFAQIFALRFLIPTNRAKEIIERDFRTKRLNFDHVIYLKNYFGVGSQAIIKILREFEYLSKTKSKEYFKIDTERYENVVLKGERKEGKKRIKGHKKIEISDRFKSLALESFHKKKIDAERLSKLIHVDKDIIIDFVKNKRLLPYGLSTHE